MHLRPRGTTLLALLVALTFVLASCARGDEDTAGGAASPTIPGTDVSPTPSGNTGAVTGASGVSGSLGTSGPSGATGATANAIEVTAVDYEFQIDADVSAGRAGFVLVNEGEEPHELLVLQLDEGRTFDDVTALLEGGTPDEPPPWIRPVGGTFAKPGETSRPAEAELEAGPTYVLACFVPTKKGVPHAELGMLRELSVATS